MLPTAIPIVCWNEDPIISLFVCFFARSVIALNGTWSVNSAAHLFGTRPFDKTIFPAESWVVSFFSVGEGWHNYHHAFPWDYKASELGSPLNTTKYFIDMLAKWGQVYDRREASHNMIKNRVMRTGDDSHKVYGTEEGQNAFTTLWNIWKHPSNPTYNSIHSPRPKIINSDGYALIESELDKKELDEEHLSRENQKMEAQQRKSAPQPDLMENVDKIKKYIVDKSDADKFISNLNVKNEETMKKLNNNNEAEFKALTALPRESDKTKLDIDADSGIFAKI